MSRISHRVGSIPPSATMAISARAKALRAQGRDVIGFGAGEPDFPTPEHIVEAAAAACRDPRNHKYTPAAGLPELREAVADATRTGSGVVVDASNVVITNGGKQAVYNTFAALLDPGDEVLVPAPYWVTYPHAIALAGGVTVEVPTDRSTGFQVSVDALERAVTDRTKMLVFVSPSNPTGAVYLPEAVREIGRWAGERGLWVMTDEIYQHLVYGDATFTSMPGVSPELEDRWVIVNGVAKTYAMTGWRVGWMVGPPDVVAAATTLQSHSTSNVANVSQRAALAALTGPFEPVEQMRAAFDRRRRTMYEMLSGIPGVEVVEPEGAFYAFPDVSAHLGREIRGRRFETVTDLAAFILDEVEVAVVPGEAFGAPGYARLSYALADADLVRGVERLQRLLS